MLNFLTDTMISLAILLTVATVIGMILGVTRIVESHHLACMKPSSKKGPVR